MKQRYLSAKTGSEFPPPPKPAFDGKPKAPKKEAAPAPAPKPRQERADSIVMRIINEIKKMGGPNPNAPEAKAADAEKKNIRKSGHDIANPNRRSPEAIADSYDAKTGVEKPMDQTLASTATRQAPPIRPPQPPRPVPPGPVSPPIRPPAPPLPPIAPPAPKSEQSPPIMPPTMQPPKPSEPLPPTMPPVQQPPAIGPKAGGNWVDAGYGQGPLNAQGMQWRPDDSAGMDPVYDGLMSAFIRRTQKR